MTDEELIAGLMAWSGSPFDDEARQAADRIEVLVKERDDALDNLRECERKIAMMEHKT